MSEYVMDANEWKAMMLEAIREGKLSENAMEWVGDCLLSAWEDGIADVTVLDEIEMLERDAE